MGTHVRLEVTHGPMKGKSFAFAEHEVFLVGRGSDCHLRLTGDPAISRHHFLIEINPPAVQIRDLDSRHGTKVNGVRHGGRPGQEAGPAPSDARGGNAPAPAAVPLADGDRIRVGNTDLRVGVEATVRCARCGVESVLTAVTRLDSDSGAVQDEWTCSLCRGQGATGPAASTPDAHSVSTCALCGRVTPADSPASRGAGEVCAACRGREPEDAIGALRRLMGTEPAAGGAAPDLSSYDALEVIHRATARAVYRARRKPDGETVAIKVVFAQIAVEKGIRTRFGREVIVHRKLQHENIVRFLEYGAAGSAFYFVMEYCQGGSVRALMRRQGGKLALVEAAPIMVQALEGLAYAHRFPAPDGPFVHRDLKPDNILLAGPEGGWTAKLADFGLAKNFEKAGLSGMTVSGKYAGTLRFMPPEQVTDFKYERPVSDVWSMAATFYNMLTGAWPFEFRDGVHEVVQVLGGTVVPIGARLPGLSRRLAQVIDRALSLVPEERYPTAVEFSTALRAAL